MGKTGVLHGVTPWKSSAKRLENYAKPLENDWKTMENDWKEMEKNMQN